MCISVRCITAANGIPAEHKPILDQKTFRPSSDTSRRESCRYSDQAVDQRSASCWQAA